MRVTSECRRVATRSRRRSSSSGMVCGMLLLTVLSLAVLPRVVHADGSAERPHADNDAGFDLGRLVGLVVPMGIATLTLMTVTVCLGLFRRLNPRALLKWHKRFGPASFISGALHALLVLLTH